MKGDEIERRKSSLRVVKAKREELVKETTGIEIREIRTNWRKFFPVGLEGRMIVMAVNYTNPKFAQRLTDEGVPLVSDENAEESATKSVVKKTLFSMKSGGNAVRMHKAGEEGIVLEGTGRPLIPQSMQLTVSGVELLKEVLKIAKQENLRMFLRTRQRVTDIGQQRKKTMKYKTKAYFVPSTRVEFPKEGKKEFLTSFPDTFKDLKDLLNASWFVKAFDNRGAQNSIVFELTYRQPEKEPTHQVSLLS